MRQFPLLLALLVPALAIAQAPAPPAWVARSNQDAQVLLRVQAQFNPERASAIGLRGYDEQVADLGPQVHERARAAYVQARERLQADLAKETDPDVREDLQIMIDAANRAIEGGDLEQRLTLDWIDAPALVFGGMQVLLQSQTSPQQHAAALMRLQRYLGMLPGSSSIFAQAKARFDDSAGDPKRIGPYRGELDLALNNAATYAAGIRKLFAGAKIAHADAALAELDRQVADYVAWERANVMPKARTDFHEPPELYAFRLKVRGIEIPPQTLIERARLEYMETRAAMQTLAPIVAKEHGWDLTDYRDVIHALKREQFAPDAVEPYYRGIVIPALEKAIAANRVVSLPNRPMIMRLASAAETAAQPAPHMLPPPLIGNYGERGQFVLTGSNPDASGKAEAFDDFNYKAAAWTLTAHEGRPGHELQFSAMVERGVSLARSLFAFNSVNVEGWALYAEAEMVPYEPHDGQLIALDQRLMRAARAMLDPMLNLGMIDRDTAFRVLTHDVGLSKPYAQQEVDRYMFRMPGQAGSYFYGYSQLMQLRAETEIALGPKFDRFAFNNFLIDQGLLPPDLLARAVRERFIPEQEARR
ncbi:MAG: DUF885 domain-containing protein [Proteobacteria bacterium]|nr:DUF885 domain-containing protein [Pseudomonadota bacterium]